MTRLLTTRSVAASHRLDYWHAICGAIIGTVACKDLDTTRFQASLDLSTVGDLKIGHFQGSRQAINRDRSLIKSGDTDDYGILIESDKTFCHEHNGRQRTGRGGIVLFDITQPYFTCHPEGLESTIVFIPRKRLEAVLGVARSAAGLVIGSDQGSFPILASFLRSLTAHGPTLNPASMARMSAIAVDLIAAGFAERMEQEPARDFNSASTLYRAKAYIDDHLGSAGLGMPEIAAAVGFSVRRLQQIASDESLSLVDWMWERRLARAHAMLTDPAHRSLSIGSVAYTCGFIDQAHFSRRFRVRFGQTPTECRVRQRPGAGPAPEDA